MALTLGIIAAGVAWERLYVSALVEQAQRTPDRPDSVAADLPAECLEELSTMGSSAMVEEPRSELPAFTGQETFGDPSSTAGNNVVRSGDAKPVSTEIGFVDPAPSLALVEGDAATRPIQRAQSAEWNAPVADPRVERSSLAGALPASAEETMRQYDLRDGLKSADVLDLMRRLRGDDGEQRARPAASWCGDGSARSIWILPGSFSVPTWRSASSLRGRCRGYRAWTRRNGCCGWRWIRSRRCGCPP